MPNLTSIIALLVALLMAPVAFAQTIILEWNPNTESDLMGYEIWRQLAPCPTDNSTTGLTAVTKIGKVSTWTDTTIPVKTRHVCYGIKAYDTSNNFSPMSNLAGKTFPRPDPILMGHWEKKTDVPHNVNQNLKTYTIHALVNAKAPLTVFSSILVKNYTYFFYAGVKGYCGDGGVMAGHGGTMRVCSPTPIPTGKWTALTATYDGTTLVLYRDKTEVGRMAMPPPADSTELLQIGGSKFNEVCNCDLEVWLYDQAMTMFEVAGLPVMPTTPVVIAVSPTSGIFTSVMNGPNPPAQIVALANGGTGVLAWTATSTPAWLTVTPSSGVGAGTLTLSVARGLLTEGTYTGSVTLKAPGAADVSVPVTYTITPDTTPPAAPSELRVVERPTAGTVILAWTQPTSHNPPTSTRIERLNTTDNTWVALTSVPAPATQATVALASSGRRVYRACALWNGTASCNAKDGTWAYR